MPTMANIQTDGSALPHINSELEERSRVKTTVHPGYQTSETAEKASERFAFSFTFAFTFALALSRRCEGK